MGSLAYSGREKIEGNRGRLSKEALCFLAF
jgi:hypothetical protein